MNLTTEDDGRVAIRMTREEARLLFEQVGRLPNTTTKRAHLIVRLYQELRIYVSMTKPASYLEENG